MLGAGYVPVQQPPAEMLEECKRLEIDQENCSEQTILSRMRTGGMPLSPSDQIEVLQNPTMLAIFGLLAAGIGGGAAVFYIKTRK